MDGSAQQHATIKYCTIKKYCPIKKYCTIKKYCPIKKDCSTELARDMDSGYLIAEQTVRFISRLLGGRYLQCYLNIDHQKIVLGSKIGILILCFEQTCKELTVYLLIYEYDGSTKLWPLTS